MNFFKTLEDTYEVLEEIGAGGGGKVYKAYHKRLEKEVVLKQIHKENQNRINARTEIDILKALKSKYLPQVFDILEVEGSVFTVMDYITGTSFEQLIRQGRRFSQGQIMRWAKELAEAAAYLHSRNPAIIHTDIKPNNIMLTEEGSICLIDFHISSHSSQGKAMAIGYSDGYSPPEQYPYNGNLASAADEDDITAPLSGIILLNSIQCGKVDARSDIYSIGATLYFMLSGARPEHSWEEVTPIEQRRHNISSGFSHIVTKAMHPVPQKRYQTADELWRALNRAGRLDKRYHKFVLKQGIALIRTMLLIWLSVSIITMGIGEIRVEKKQAFEAAAILLEQQLDTEDYEGIHEALEQIHLHIGGEPEAFDRVAMIFYEEEEYGMSVSFLEEALTKYPFLNSRSGIDRLYYILADCYFMMGEFQTAAIYFGHAISYEQTNTEYYRDYAISLIRTGNEAEALKVLSQAERYSTANSDLLMIRGEIFFYLEDYERALKEFIECIEYAEQDSIKMRAYLMAARSYREEQQYTEGIALLTEAKTKLPLTLRFLVLELLAQFFIDLGSIHQDEKSFLEAISILEEIRAMGLSTYEMDHTLTILYQQVNQFQNSAFLLEEMLILYGEDYNIYKRLSFLEADLQSQKQIADRSYKFFMEYYHKSFDLYEIQARRNKTDGEMRVLERLYEGLVTGGWSFAE